jgi:DNA modification methylase
MQHTLERLIHGDLDFHAGNSRYASHNFHAFPAKFPPQLPRHFIQGLTAPGEVVLDPMVGSGTTLVEAALTGRQGLAYDIDSLAVLLASVKTRPLDPEAVLAAGERAIARARASLERELFRLKNDLARRGDANTRQFINYWFTPETQPGLLALLQAIQTERDLGLRQFLLVAFSSTIITRSGDVSLAIDLAHTRPHRAKLAHNEQGAVVFGAETALNPERPRRYQEKIVRAVLPEFERQLRRNAVSLLAREDVPLPPRLCFGNAQRMPLPDASVDLIVTSPPYVANAIDYMRAHKFTLVWLGYPVGKLSHRRKRYIGHTTPSARLPDGLPPLPAEIVAQVGARDVGRGLALQRYFSEMTRTLGQMVRVLKPGRAAVVVIGDSTIRGIDTRTGECLAQIGEEVGFASPCLGIRRLDRDRRMMPVSANGGNGAGIQRRMHEETVIGFHKPG